MATHSQSKTSRLDPSSTPEPVGYELDDGPLSEAQIQAIQKLADQQAFTGASIRESSLLSAKLSVSNFRDDLMNGSSR